MVPAFNAVGDYMNPAINQNEVRAFKKALSEMPCNDE